MALLQAKLQAAQKWYGAFQQAYAGANPEEAAKMYMDKVEQSKLDRQVYQAFASTPEGLTPEQQRMHLLSKKPDGMSMVDWAKTLTAFWPGTKMGSQAGKQMQDRATIVQQYGEDSPQVKQFDEQVSKGKEKTELKTFYGPNGETNDDPCSKGQAI